ncbi:MAG: hypothetical protein Q8R28_22770, partial [Dehalococcoidia bacterium]|nr:hypothetical protein [Dehalococcoidia bacterium]
ALGLRTDAAKRYKMVENATAVIWKMLLIGEKKFRRLNAHDLMKKLYLQMTSPCPRSSSARAPVGLRQV